MFPTGGPNQPPQPSMATLLNRMRLCPANVIFRNVFLSPSAVARPHVDDDCFVTKHTFLIHFGDPIPLQWDNSTIYLKHCGIYAFDASKKHSLPIWPRFSISLDVLHLQLMVCLLFFMLGFVHVLLCAPVQVRITSHGIPGKYFAQYTRTFNPLPPLVPHVVFQGAKF